MRVSVLQKVSIEIFFRRKTFHLFFFWIGTEVLMRQNSSQDSYGFNQSNYQNTTENCQEAQSSKNHKQQLAIAVLPRACHQSRASLWLKRATAPAPQCLDSRREVLATHPQRLPMRCDQVLATAHIAIFSGGCFRRRQTPAL